ncbi:hypothetical protein, partial [Acidiphilium sp.]|uniref:hypothetical protein n=1 Tax=Acidiphilium sp. TaxID=527 RepID=UPI00258EC0BF
MTANPGFTGAGARIHRRFLLELRDRRPACSDYLPRRSNYVIGARYQAVVLTFVEETGLRPESRFGELSATIAKRIDDGHAAQCSSGLPIFCEKDPATVFFGGCPDHGIP